MAGRLEGKVALVTGIAGGQGRAAALLFAAEGATVVGADLDPEGAGETVRLGADAGGGLTGVAPVDLADPDRSARWVADAAEAHGQIDVLLNNASAARFAPITDLTLDDWHFTLRNELDLVFLVTRAAWPHLVASGGVVINTASVAAHRGNRTVSMLAHATTKGGLLAMTRQLAVEGGPHGVRAVSISPGVVETPATADLLSRPGVRDALVAEHLVPRIGTAQDVAELALFVASDAARHLTGTDIVLDGGASSY
ncbi:SDR family NAD(P)-dependent oxidoreductase [Pseudonocardia endophytica]|uniref:NAD(P)-dependent dehydrogenase (Short-subunit alcohol dehydrogenase family) n=1 Tax=Pseudonocardia endophytica TaxID=401976 RepID=A0A4R1HII9_PSEEN|nr:SDR family NAD(P)-dependent oxidoreductase [Pseudonocardia endophytica]TCK22067.1 NAD(P)-dependent dehydrogenase (short-subunit alcohol dehydrogenase family) [Pseudonocardia endophytica]